MSSGDNLTEITVSLFVFDQKNKVIGLIGFLIIFYPYFTADNRFYSCIFCFFIKLNSSVESVMVS
ncbi:hypothetical protein ES703_26886 [subsurface metagenome]